VYLQNNVKPAPRQDNMIAIQAQKLREIKQVKLAVLNCSSKSNIISATSKLQTAQITIKNIK
jgi:hypothetical protein